MFLLIISVILLFFFALSYLSCHKNFANYLVNILIAICTCEAVIQALYLSIPKKKILKNIAS